jgi:hypothetical protein
MGNREPCEKGQELPFSFHGSAPFYSWQAAKMFVGLGA